MKKFTVIVLAVLGVVLVATGGVVAHGSGDSDHADPKNDTAAEWDEWMERHMTEHMGADAAERMQEWMGMSYGEMDERMASEGSSIDGMGCH